MKCPEVTRRLAEYQLGGLTPWGRARLDRHLRGCATCRAEEAALARTGQLLSHLELEIPPDYGWTAVRAVISSRARRRSPRPAVRWALAGALTVGLVCTAIVAPRTLNRPPEISPTAVADQDMKAAVAGHLSDLYSAPLSDPAATGLRLDSVEDDS